MKDIKDYEIKTNQNFSSSSILGIMSLAAAPISFPLALGIMIYDMYEAEKGNKEELKKPVPDSWLEKIANDETLSDEGLKFLAKKLEKQGFVSIEDSYKWIQIEEDIAKKKLEDLNKEINLNKTGAISLLNRVKNTKSLNISFDETFQKIQEVKKNLDFNKFDSVLNNIKSLNKYFKK